MARTIVYQSYRTHDVPDVIALCMESCRNWAAAKGLEYRFFDDSFFELVPAWMREKCRQHVLPVTDIARLIAARQFLNVGYDRTIWVDADVLIFDPNNFSIDESIPSAFIRETWLERDSYFRPVIKRHVANAVCTFTNGSALLDFCIERNELECQKALSIHPLQIGTRFLTDLHRLVPFDTLQNVGLFSPTVIADELIGEGNYVAAYMQAHGSPIFAANLCASVVGRQEQGYIMSYDDLLELAAHLQRSKGREMNSRLDEPPISLVRRWPSIDTGKLSRAPTI